MDISKLAEYNIWANRQIGKQVESLPQEIFENNLGVALAPLKQP